MRSGRLRPNRTICTILKTFKSEGTIAAFALRWLIMPLVRLFVEDTEQQRRRPVDGNHKDHQENRAVIINYLTFIITSTDLVA